MIREFFYLQKSDRKVILTLLCVVVVAFGVIFLTGGEQDPPSPSSLSGQSDLSGHSTPASYASRTGHSPERFYFDPNTADSTQLLKLGLQPWQVRNIYKYRAAGGVYRKPLDFAKLYGLTVKQYRELEPYIRISPDYLPASTLLETERRSSAKDVAKSSVAPDSLTRRYPVKIKETEHVVLNTADTTALMTIPGIGPYYARKIVEYGERLGGYVSVSQLDEIEDFPTSSKKYLVIQNPQTRKINVNKLSLNELKRHPYINYYRAKAITDYRRLNGPLKSLNDLSLSKDFPQEVIQRLSPYVAY